MSNIRFISFDGFSKSTLYYGVGDEQVGVRYKKSGTQITSPLKVDGAVRSSHVATADDDLLNLKGFMERTAVTLQDAKSYTDNAIQNLDLSGAGSTSPQLNTFAPISLTPENVTDAATIEFGEYPTNTFLDRVVVEFKESFVFENDDDYVISVGTYANHELLVPNRNLSTLTATNVFDIQLTLDTATLVAVFITKVIPPVPEPTIPDDFISHEYDDVIVNATSDASNSVYSVTMSGLGLESDPTAVTRFNMAPGSYAKIFGLNIHDLTAGQYKIIEENKALGLNTTASEDTGIVEYDGTYRQESTFTIETPTGEYQHVFAMTEPAVKITYYEHIYLQQFIDDEWVGIKTYHILNHLDFAGTASDQAIGITSISPGITVEYTAVEDNINDVDIALHGTVESRTAYVNQHYGTEIDTSIYMNMIGLEIVTNTQIGESIRWMVTAPAFEYFVEDHVDIQFEDGVYFIENEITAVDDDTILNIMIPLLDGPEECAVVLADIDNPDASPCTITIANDVTLTESTIVDTPTVYETFAVQSNDVDASTDIGGKAIIRMLTF